MISTMRDSGSRSTSFEYSRHACKVAVQPFVSDNQFIADAGSWHQATFLSQKMAQKDPEKKMSSTEANAIMHLAKLAVVVSHHLRAQYAFRWMQGTVSIVRLFCGIFDVRVD